MWLNPKTGKGWSDAEEADFAQLMAAGNLERLPAIRLYRRMKCDLQKALKYARERAVDHRKQDAGLAKARAAK